MRALLFALLLWQTAQDVRVPSPDQRYFQYRRAITLPVVLPTGDNGTQGCVTLDGQVYAHGALSLKDLRLHQGTHEVPYAITLSESAESDSESAAVTNLGLRDKRIVFDLEMPDRLYTDVTLDLDAHDFIASAEVSGITRSGEAPIRLGTFTLFDLSAQHLSRSTTLHLQESRFHTLHVELSVFSAPGSSAIAKTSAIVLGATVPPSREAQIVYTSVDQTSSVIQRGRQTVATFHLPAHVPVERISFATAPGFTGNFSRNIEIVARTQGAPDSAEETLTGDILRVRLNQAGREIRQQQLSVPATLGANLQTDAIVEVRIDNGDDTPLPISSVSLEMRQRRLCFNTPAAGTELTLFYGDSVLDAPVYDFARLFSPSSGIVLAKLGGEQQNPAYVPRPAPLRPLTERHPELLWIVLLAVVCILAVVAINSSKRLPK